MKRYLLLFAIVIFSQVPFALQAEQAIAGLKLEYPNRFTSNPSKSKEMMSGTPANVMAVIKSFELFVASPANGLKEVILIKITYDMRIQPNIDGTASESLNAIARLDGMINFKHSTTSLTISGFEARRSSFTADRFNAKMGGEQLVVLNRQNNTIWQIQTLFGKEKGLNPFASLNLDAETKFAVSFLASVTVQK